MHICHITINPINHERRILNQTKSAISKGFKVEIVSLNKPGSERANIPDKTELHLIKTPFYRGGVLKFLHFNWNVFVFLVRRKLEIIHCHDLWVLPSALILRFIKKCHLIYDAHEFYGGLEVFNRNKIRKKIWLAVEYFAVPWIDVLITVSQPLADLYRKKYSRLKQVIVIRNLPEKEVLSDTSVPLVKTSDPVILFQGHFRPGRGLINLIEAFSQIKDAHLVMIGGGDMEGELKSMVLKKRLGNSVSFLGYIPTDELIQTAARADLGVVLFEPTSLNYRYALPNKFFEYIMAGIPVLASNIDTFKSYMETYQIGLTVDPSDVEEIKRTLTKMLTDRDMIIYWRKNAQKASQELNWESESLKMNHIYEDLT
jgi:glycosyltransferase involved in cell wall biosynthesis